MKINKFQKHSQSRKYFAKKGVSLHKNKNGQALIEFALLLPILLLLVLAMIEYGWLLNAKITLNSAAREGARVGAVLIPSTDRKQKIYETVRDTIDVSGLTVELGDITLDDKIDYLTNTKDIVVTVNGEVEPIIGLYVPDVVTMKSVARMRRE